MADCRSATIRPRPSQMLFGRESPGDFRSVAPVSSRRLNGGDGLQIELDHLLKRRRRGAIAEAFGQDVEPRHALGLNRQHFDERVVPALCPASPRRRRAAFDRGRRLEQQPSGAMTGLAFGVTERDVPVRFTASGHRFSSLRNVAQGARTRPAQAKRARLSPYGPERRGGDSCRRSFRR